MRVIRKCEGKRSCLLRNQYRRPPSSQKLNRRIQPQDLCEKCAKSFIGYLPGTIRSVPYLLAMSVPGVAGRLAECGIAGRRLSPGLAECY
jgi:hypothetical protein